MATTASTPPLETNQRPLWRYLLGIVALGITLLTIPVVLGQDASLFLLINQYVVMLGGAVLLARRSGPGGVRRLFSGLFHVRIGWVNWGIAVAAMPVATIGVALATGTYTSPADGWFNFVTDYLYVTFIYGALAINLAEETVWVGLVQRNLARRHGLLRGAALTAIPFALMHIPITLADAGTVTEAAIFLGALFVVAPVMRYVLGRTDLVTGGSLLAAGIFHAAFNASGNLDTVDGDWQYAVGLVVVAVVLFVSDVIRAHSSARPMHVDTPGSVTTHPAAAVR